MCVCVYVDNTSLLSVLAASSGSLHATPRAPPGSVPFVLFGGSVDWRLVVVVVVVLVLVTML